MLVSSAGAALVTGRRDMFKGVINVQTVMDAITRSQTAAVLESDQAPVGLNTGVFQAQASAASADEATADTQAAQ
jgi:osmoprotectant transport system ATP-binding protein